MIRAFSMLRNRMLADPSFLFKVGTEVGAMGQLFFRVFKDGTSAVANNCVMG
jgi:hypothetical protein